MKNIILLILFLFSVQSFAQYTETRTLSSFENIEAKNGVIVEVFQSNSSKAIIETESKEQQNYIETKVSGNTLYVSINSKKSSKKLVFKKLKIKVYTQKLNSIDLSGASILKIQDQFQTANLSVKLKGASQMNSVKAIQSNDLKIDVRGASILQGIFKAKTTNINAAGSSQIKGTLTSESVHANIVGASIVNLEGSSDRLFLEVEGSSIVNTIKLKSKQAQITSKSSSVVESWVTDSLDAKAFNTAQVSIKGEPKKLKVETKNVGLIANKNGKIYSNNL